MWRYKKLVIREGVVVWKTGQQVGEANTLVSVSFISFHFECEADGSDGCAGLGSFIWIRFVMSLHSCSLDLFPVNLFVLRHKFCVETRGVSANIDDVRPGLNRGGNTFRGTRCRVVQWAIRKRIGGYIESGHDVSFGWTRLSFCTGSCNYPVLGGRWRWEKSTGGESTDTWIFGERGDFEHRWLITCPFW